jgi:hypothetical protein
MKIRVFELAKSKNLPISRTVELLAQKGVLNATAVTYVEADALDDVAEAQAGAQTAPSAQGETSERSSAVARNILEKSSARGGWERDEPRSSESTVVYLSVGLGALALVLVAFLFFSERSNRAEMGAMQAEINLLKAANAKIEDVVVGNRAQIMETRDQVVAVEKRFYEFKRTSLMTQLKSQGVVLKALSENMREPLKSKAQALANGLSTF